MRYSAKHNPTKFTQSQEFRAGGIGKPESWKKTPKSTDYKQGKVGQKLQEFNIVSMQTYVNRIIVRYRYFTFEKRVIVSKRRHHKFAGEAFGRGGEIQKMSRVVGTTHGRGGWVYTP